jgi:ribosomal protein L40E
VPWHEGRIPGRGKEVMMAKLEIPYQPALTADDVMDIFRRHFAGKYEIRNDPGVARQFLVKKSAWSAVLVRLKHEKGTTSIHFVANVPPGIGRLLSTGLVPYLVAWLILRAEWNVMEAEVRSFIENAPEFCGTSPPTDASSLAPAQARPQLVTCTSCGASVAENARYCRSCGTPVPVPDLEPLPSASPPLQEGSHCTRCGTLLPQSSLYCHKCGSEVASATTNDAQTAADASEPGPQAALKRGYCGRCGQELGVNEKVRGFTVHEKCPALAPAESTG